MEHKRQYDREREKRRPPRRHGAAHPDRQKEWIAAHPDYMKNWRAAHPDHMKEYRARFPEREQARQRLNRARRAGRILKLDCEICGTPDRVEAHHAFGYEPEMALAVWWLCRTHHEAMHSAVHWAA